MHFRSKKVLLLILVVTSMVCSRALFFFIDDPEGPNLLVVTVMACIIYSLSFVVYLHTTSLKLLFQHLYSLSSQGQKSLLPVIGIQMILATIFWFFLM
jgi:hypothetical protein